MDKTTPGGEASGRDGDCPTFIHQQVAFYFHLRPDVLAMLRILLLEQNTGKSGFGKPYQRCLKYS